ncbi:MAG: WzyE family oligosaccharide polymerase [Cyclobacteriaceae bacterium]
MYWSLLILFVTLVYLVLKPEKIRERVFSSLFILMFALTYFGGLFVIQFVSEASPVSGFKSLSGEINDGVIGVPAISLLFLIFGNSLRTNRNRDKEVSYSTSEGVISIFLACLSILLYVAINGVVLFKSSSYDARYESNVGLGLLTKYINFGLVFLIQFYIVSRAKLTSYLYALIFCAAVFSVMGGYRQVAFAAILNVILLQFIEGRFTLKRLILYFTIGIIVINFVALLRYGISIQDLFSSDSLRLVVFFFFDGLIPVDAFLRIVDYCEVHKAPGLSIPINQFLSYVPRFIWSDKPIVIMNAGNFYTSVILNRTNFITYSPTFLGELYLIGGKYACFVGSFSAGVLIRKLDSYSTKQNIGLKSIFVLSFGFLIIFNLYREGFFVALSLIFILLVLYVPIHLLNHIIPKKIPNEKS